MTDFIGKVVQRLLVKEINEGQIASINCRVFSIVDGFEIRIEGINDKIDIMLSEVLSKISNFNPTESEFESFKTLFTDDWKSQLLSEGV